MGHNEEDRVIRQTVAGEREREKNTLNSTLFQPNIFHESMINITIDVGTPVKKMFLKIKKRQSSVSSFQKSFILNSRVGVSRV